MNKEHRFILGELAEDFRRGMKDHRILCALIFLLAAAQLIRLFFGIDVTDESYYFTNALRLTQGDRLFKDIWDSTQTQGLVLYPLYLLYTALFGVNGLLLLNRITFFGLVVITALCGYAYLRGHVRKTDAALCMACFLAFAPACLYTTGYNHLAYCLCFLGVFLFLSTAGRLQSRSRRPIFVPILAGCIHGLMVAAYPVDVLLTPFLFLSLLLYARRVSGIKGKALARLMGLYLIGLLLVAVPFLLYVLFQVGLESMLLFLQAISENPSTTSFADSFARLYRLGVQAFSVLKGMRFGWMLGAAALGGLGVAVFFSAASARERRSGPAGLISGKPFFFRRWLLALLSVYGVACIFVARLHVNLTVQPQMYATLCCLMLPLTLPALRGEDHAAVGRLFLGVGVPSILLTLLNSMASGGGFAQSCYGMIGVFLVTAAAVSLLVRRVFPGEEARSPARKLPGMKKAVGTVLYGVAPLFFAIVLLGLEYGYVYCDNPPISSCTALVKSGAGAGIRTTPAQAKTLNDMAEDLERAAEGRETLLCMDCFSYGYGLTGRLRPCAPSTWMVSAFAFRDWGTYDAYWTNFFTYCAYRGEEPDVILYAAEKPFSQLYDPAYSLHPYIKKNYTCLVEREDYQIFVRNPQVNQNTEEPT